MPFCIGGSATTANQYGTLAATDYIDAMRKLAAFLDRTNFHARSFAVAAGGAGYAVDDVVTLDGGIPVLDMRASIRVTSVSGGVVTGVEPASMGCYGSTPAGNGQATTAVVGAGGGLTVDVTAGINAYTLERDETVDGGPERELIVRGDGLDGLQSIYWGMQTHRNEAADFYNIKVQGMAGFNNSLSLIEQPGADDVINLPSTADIPLLNSTLPFFFYVNDQFVYVVMRPSTVYMHGHAGFGRVYGPPSSYPYPLTWGGCTAGPERLSQAYRFSEASAVNANILFPARGASYIRYLGGQNYPVAFNTDGNGGSLNSSSEYIRCYPYSNYLGSSNKSLNGVGMDGRDLLLNTRDTNGERPFFPIQIFDGGQAQRLLDSMIMELDRVYAVPGFALNSEDTLIRDGVKYRVFQNVFRTGRDNFIAVEES